MRRGLVRISHRGGGALAPENSLEGIRRALDYGVEMVEVDVRSSIDGALVLSHDDLLHGTDVRISASTLARLRDAGPHGIATLDDALDLAGDRARLNLDIKDGSVTDRIVERVRAHGATGRVIVSGLEMAPLAQVAALEPSIPRFFSYPVDRGGASTKPLLKPVVSAAVTLMRLTLPLRLAAMLRPLPGTNATIYNKLLTRRLADTAHAMGIHLYTWTIDDAGAMHQAAALGVDGITSNRPDLLAQMAPTQRDPTHTTCRT
jgi:glycerophosphoryl diester phosphodiesterase